MAVASKREDTQVRIACCILNRVILIEDGSYYNDGTSGGDPFVSGDLEINNEAYNNPAVMVSRWKAN